MARHTIGSDHALLTASAIASRCPGKWPASSRARFVCGELPGQPLVDAADIAALARSHTKPISAKRYVDPPCVHEAIHQAKMVGGTAAWKHVHKTRRLARHAWEADRLSAIMKGDWAQYRQRKRERHKRSGWWGTMLQKCGDDLTAKTREHLAGKLCGPSSQTWEDELNEIFRGVQITNPWVEFTHEEVRQQLGQMKSGSAVGPDQIGVDLLRAIVSHELLAGDLVDIINHIVRNTEVPESWDQSLLALLAKVDVPQGPHELRPIAMSSALQKLVSRLVMHRTFPILRRGTDICCSGKNRQAADLVGCLTHLRDVTHEWRMPLLIAKLDIRGAFDSLSRKALAMFLVDKLQHCGAGHDLRYLLRQLRPNQLLGRVPGGDYLELWCTTGIRQGSPESAELFALILQDALEHLMSRPTWRSLGQAIPELGVEVLMYQDDLILWDDDPNRLIRRFELINSCLAELGLQLSPSKTAVGCTKDYVGPRVLTFADQRVSVLSASDPLRVLGLQFSFDGDHTRQARELIGRLRAAFGEHRQLLRGRASWQNKLFALRMLVEGQISWVAGAVYWSPQDLATLNTMQLHVLRDIFHIHRFRDETWVDFNQRSLRYVRAWMHHHGCERWSTKVRTLQFGLAGHWCRQTEDDGRGVLPKPGLPARFLRWRNVAWWRRQQCLSPEAGGLRHPSRFFPAGFERDLAQHLGCEWMSLGEDRVQWGSYKSQWLRCSDQPWCRGRQLALPQ